MEPNPPREVPIAAQDPSGKENVNPGIEKEPSVILTPVSPIKRARRDILMPNINLQEPNCFQELIEV